MHDSIPSVRAEAVHAALDWRSLVDALRAAFAAGATAPVRASHEVTAAGDRLLLMPAWDGAGLGVKIVTVFPRNRERGLASVAALYLLMDGATGHPVALIDGEALTLRRTAASSALASSYLSRTDATTLVVVGAGALAPYMAQAHCAVRPIERVLVWGRHADRAERTAAQLASIGLPARAIARLEDGLAAADIVTCATTAREPVVRGAQLRPGTHVDLVGAFTREMREGDDDLVARAEVFVDTRAGALKEAGDLVQPIERGVFARENVRAELSDLARGDHPGRRSADEVTLFKSVGTALEDLCAARLVASRLGREAAG
ncbi:MAG: ornithine cyclodeaminase family protein [Burkholderiales bacterium]|jgi:ornithine cyclodeaminase|nr:ornithine cyclodeaminase family protein [Burkholderiales bacterium]